jgi:hypothetical protein
MGSDRGLGRGGPSRPAAGNFETGADLRLGAKEEGVLRKHAVTSTGRMRDTVYYSILEDEWPEVKARPEKRLEREDSSAITAPRTTG